jgi:hypothetical protein
VSAFHIVFGGSLYRAPIESVMLIEARIFRGNDGMLEIERDLLQRNELVSFAVRRVTHPSLEAALNMHCSRRRVDPAGSHEGQRGKQPKKGCCGRNPSKEESERDLKTSRLAVCVLVSSHSPE